MVRRCSLVFPGRLKLLLLLHTGKELLMEQVRLWLLLLLLQGGILLRHLLL